MRIFCQPESKGQICVSRPPITQAQSESSWRHRRANSVFFRLWPGSSSLRLRPLFITLLYIITACYVKHFYFYDRASSLIRQFKALLVPPRAFSQSLRKKWQWGFVFLKGLPACVFEEMPPPLSQTTAVTVSIPVSKPLRHRCLFSHGIICLISKCKTHVAAVNILSDVILELFGGSGPEPFLSRQ